MSVLTRLTIGLAIGAASLGSAGCDRDSKIWHQNPPVAVYNTVPGQQLKSEMFLGKWDLDGERTNKANGQTSAASIPSSILKDVMGKGWRFEKDGVLLTDTTGSARAGKWAIEGTDTLAVQEHDQTEPTHYTARFSDGYLKLTRADGKIMVFQRDKFYGF